MAQPAPQSQHEIRQRNLSRVLHTLAAEGALSRAAIAARIGLTRAAVSTLADELLRGGLLVEQTPGRSGTVGRPGTRLALTDQGPCGIGAEIGVDHLAVCAMDLRGEVRARISQATRNQGSEPGAVLERLTALLRQVVGEAARAGLWPTGLTVAVPGLVARDGHGQAMALRAPNLGWRDTDLSPLLPTDLGPVTVDNEANLGALAELWRGRASPAGDLGPAGENGDTFIHVSAEIGIGAALVVDGELLRGARGFAGELGHVPVWPKGHPCSCGARGCLEVYASEEAVLRAAGLEPGPGVRLGVLTARCAAGEREALRAVQQAGSALGIALSGAVNLIDPRRVVIGGALAQLASWLLPRVGRELAHRTLLTAGSRSAPVPVIASAIGPDGPLLGAAGSAVRAALDQPSTLLG